MFVFVFVLFCSINNKLQQPEAASGVLEYAMKHFGELVSASFCFQLKKGNLNLGCIQWKLSTAVFKLFKQYLLICILFSIVPVATAHTKSEISIF